MKILNSSVQVFKGEILIVVECENEQLFYSLGRFRKGYTLEEEYKVYQLSQHFWTKVIEGIGVLHNVIHGYEYSHIIVDLLDTSGYTVPLKRTTRGELMEMVI